MLLSIIIRTYNEQRYLPELLRQIATQSLTGHEYEIIVVDSGSSDNSLNIAKQHDCQIYHIDKQEFSFGRSLNIGCTVAQGEILVFISGHCVPVGQSWLQTLISPIAVGEADYVYGRQIGGPETRLSEQRHYEKHFPGYDKHPQNGFFCNNANAAIRKASWSENHFDEALTGLEDMHLAKRLVKSGQSISYLSEAAVIHHHDEKAGQIRNRYEREAVALRSIMPEIQFSLIDLVKYCITSIFSDIRFALSKGKLIESIGGIIVYRSMQKWGSYRGHQRHRQLSNAMKYQYYYPKDVEKEHYEQKNCRPATPESS